MLRVKHFRLNQVDTYAIVHLMGVLLVHLDRYS
jgi:hypothetical protein